MLEYGMDGTPNEEPPEEYEFDLHKCFAVDEKGNIIKSKLYQDEFAKQMIAKYHIKAVGKTLDTSAIYTYDPERGIYVCGNRELRRKMDKCAAFLKQAQKTEIRVAIEDKAPLYKGRESNFFIACENGIIDVANPHHGLMEHDPKFFIKNRIPWRYRPELLEMEELPEGAQKMDTFLTKIADGVLERRIMISQMIGYALLPTAHLRKFFVMVGEKRNGKSTLLEVISALVGDENVTELNFEELGEKFLSAELNGKLVCMGDDANTDYMDSDKTMATIRKVSSGGAMMVQRKGEHPFTIIPYATVIIAANKFASVKSGAREANNDRTMFIKLTHTFCKENDGKDFDPTIGYTLSNDADAMEYLLALAVESAKQVVADKEFFVSKESEKELDDYAHRNDPLLLWLDDYLLDDIEGQWTDDLFKDYREFCQNEEIHGLSKIEWSRRICERFRLTTVARQKVDPYTGIKKKKRIFVKSDEFERDIAKTAKEIASKYEKTREYFADKSSELAFIDIAAEQVVKRDTGQSYDESTVGKLEEMRQEAEAATEPRAYTMESTEDYVGL